MKKRLSIFYLIAIFNALGISFAQAQLPKELRLTSDINGTATYTFSTTDVLYTINNVTSYTSHACFPAPYNQRINLAIMILELKSTAVNRLVIHGKSATPEGTTIVSERYLRLSVADSYDGPYTEIIPLENIIRFVGTANCQAPVVEGLNIPVGKFIKLEFTNNSNDLTKKANIMLTGFDLNSIASNVEIQMDDNVFFDGKVIRNPDKEQLQIYDITGRLLNTSKDEVSMSQYNKGVYIVKTDKRTLKISNQN